LGNSSPIEHVCENETRTKAKKKPGGKVGTSMGHHSPFLWGFTISGMKVVEGGKKGEPFGQHTVSIYWLCFYTLSWTEHRGKWVSGRRSFSSSSLKWPSLKQASKISSVLSRSKGEEETRRPGSAKGTTANEKRLIGAEPEPP